MSNISTFSKTSAQEWDSANAIPPYPIPAPSQCVAELRVRQQSDQDWSSLVKNEFWTLAVSNIGIKVTFTNDSKSNAQSRSVNAYNGGNKSILEATEPLIPNTQDIYDYDGSDYSSSNLITSKVANPNGNYNGMITVSSQYNVTASSWKYGAFTNDYEKTFSFRIANNPIGSNVPVKTENGVTIKCNMSGSVYRENGNYFGSLSTFTIPESDYGKYFYLGASPTSENAFDEGTNTLYNTRVRVDPVYLGKPRLSINKSDHTLRISANTGSIKSYRIWKDGNFYKDSSFRTINLPDSDYYGSHVWTAQAIASDNLEFDADDSSSKIVTIGSAAGQIVTYPLQNTLLYNVYVDSNVSEPLRSSIYESEVSDLSIRQYDVNKLQASWTRQTDTSRFMVKLDDSAWVDTGNDNMSWDNVRFGSHTVYVASYYSGDSTVNVNQGTAASSSGSRFASVSMVRLDPPTDIRFTRTAIAGGYLEWSSPHPDDENTEYEISVNGTVQGTQSDVRMLVQDLPFGANSFSVSQRFNPDHDYDSDKAQSETVYMTKLNTPALSHSDIKGAIYNEPGNPSSGIAKQDGIIGVRLSYPNTNIYNGVAASGISWRIYDVRYDSGGNRIEDPTPIDSASDSLSVLWTDRGAGTIYDSWGYVGKHSISVQCIYSANHDYDSEISAAYEYTINTLSKPGIAWKSVSAGLDSDQSVLTWYPNSESNADFYIVYAIGGISTGTNNALGSITRILQPSDTSSKIECRIADPDYAAGDWDVNDMGIYRGLITDKPERTQNYKVCVAASSFSPWYTATSDTATADYQICVLDSPTGVSWDANEYRLSWNAITDPNPRSNSRILYWVYDNVGKGDERIPDPDNSSIKFQTSDTSVSFPKGYFDAYQHDSNIHVLRISAVKITEA